jgi:hypothetical protein
MILVESEEAVISSNFTTVTLNRGEYAANVVVSIPKNEKKEFVVGWATNERPTDNDIIEKIKNIANLLKVETGIIELKK